MFQTGDLVRIKRGFVAVDDDEFHWIGVILSYRGRSNLGDEDEWMVHWAHQPYEAVEFGYYLEVL